jgi:uncharacterized phage protein gp47/JayE
MARSFTDIVNSMIAFITNANPTIDTSEGTPVNDIVISAPAAEMANLYQTSENVSLAQSPLTANDDDLVKRAYDLNLVQKQARSARGSITFFSRTLPVSDVLIPVGSAVSTSAALTTASLSFITTRAVTMYAVLGANYLNPNTGVYEISTDIQAVTAGTAGNAGANTINTVTNPLSGIDGCYNASTVEDGEDVESSASLAARISTRISGNVLGTEDGILEVVLAQEGVDAATVIAHGQTGRDAFGAIDVYVKGTTTRFQQDTFNYGLSPTPNLLLTRQPVLLSGVTAVLSSVSGSVSTTQWSLVKDTGTYGGSILALDSVNWTAPFYDSNDTLTVQYSYNGLVEDLQNLFTQTNVDPLNTSLLIKWAIQTPINITANISIAPGFDSTSVINQAQIDINTYLGTLSIGDPIIQSDIAGIIINEPGVTDVQLPFATFQSADNSIFPDSIGNLILPSYAYPSGGTITFNMLVNV